ncbi:hypothetical protein [Solilutibacter tolerans]|uniref:Uncharacterized protein n=1 Tax=Solilutibacter tolerans TaxID=1604334 RepID=A0A1N6RZW1_9GAMM|nr:hypothetical protein [Lysobacter tolerans]SIQ34398.1 hypothetical protein SAMN05421546_1143 [Lysobacter tolerans]
MTLYKSIRDEQLRCDQLAGGKAHVSQEGGEEASDAQPTLDGQEQPIRHAAPVSFNLGDFLGVLAGETGQAREGERDIIASAIQKALGLCNWDQLPTLSSILRKHGKEFQRRAIAGIGKRSTVEGHIGNLPFLALCVEIQAKGFIESDGMRSRALLFLSLVDLAANTGGVIGESAYSRVCDGLRLLIERLHKSPTSDGSIDQASVWQLIEWVDQHRAIRNHTKAAFKTLAKKFFVAWRASPSLDGRPEEDDEADGDAVPLVEGLNGLAWTLPFNSRYEAELPPELQRKLLTSELTRITALSRYCAGSLLMRTQGEMKRAVGGLLEASIDGGRQAIASLLAIGTCTSAQHVFDIRWADPKQPMPEAPSFPGILTPDAKFLVRSEFDPRSSSADLDEEEPSSEFHAKALYIPVPPTLTNLLIKQRSAAWPRTLVIPASILGEAVPRESSAWETTTAARLMRDKRFGISAAQHVLHTSFGLDTAPLFYDRIPAGHLAHMVAGVTHPWFGDKATPWADGLPSHNIGSQRVVPRQNVVKSTCALRATWAEELELWERVGLRARNFVVGASLSLLSRHTDNFYSLSLKTVDLEEGLVGFVDKRVSVDHPGRLGILGTQVALELRRYLTALEEARERYKGLALGDAASRILEGHQSLFLTVQGPDACAPMSLADLSSLRPDGSEHIGNWTRQFALDALSVKLPESLRVSAAGWHGTRAGNFSELSAISPLNALLKIRTAIDAMLTESGWKPLPGQRDPRPELMTERIQWVKAIQAHEEAFRRGIKRLQAEEESRLQEFATAALPAVNAYFRAIEIPLEATEGGLIGLRGGKAVELTRQHHSEMLRAMGGVKARSIVARRLLKQLLGASRKAGITKGPLPRSVVQSYPVHPSPFLAEGMRSLHHREEIRNAALSSSLSAAARTFLAVLLDGWIANSALVLRLMHPGAKLHDLNGRDVLLIEPAEAACDSSDHLGCVAYSGFAALALRAWHRSGNAAVVDREELESELLAVLGHALAPAISKSEICAELEMLMRSYLALTVPGLIRDVAVGRISPRFAPLERVRALLEDEPIFPSATIVQSAERQVVGGAAKARKLKAMEGYNAVKDVLTWLDDEWRPDKSDEVRTQAALKLYRMVPAEGAKTGVHLIALYGAGYISEGLHKDKVRPVTVRDAVYRVGAPLLAALPDQMDVMSQAAWQTVYAKIIFTAEPSQRARLAGDLAHFQNVMHRDHGLPRVGMQMLLSAMDVPCPPQKLGFLTAAEEKACRTMADLRVAQTSNDGAPSDKRLAICIRAVLGAGLATSLRDREYRLPLVDDWSSDPRVAPHIKLRTNGQDFVKTQAGRRAAHLSGPHYEFARAAIASQRELNKLFEEFSRRQKLFDPDSSSEGGSLLTDALAQVNADIRYVVGNANAGIELTRKSWALRAFGALDPSDNGLWQARDMLSEIGQASIAVTLGYYLHNPVVFLARIPRAAAIHSKEAGWLLGMAPKSAKHLLCKKASWLAPRKEDRTVAFPANAFSIFGHSSNSFEPTLRDAERLTDALASSISLRSALIAVGWPLKLESALAQILVELEEAGVLVGSVTDERLRHLHPPLRRQSDSVFDQLRIDAGSWKALAWLFGRWLEDWRSREMEGITASSKEWSEKVTAVGTLASLDWVSKPIRHLNFYQLNRAKPGAHSFWPSLLWMAFAAWIRGQVVISMCSMDKEV